MDDQDLKAIANELIRWNEKRMRRASHSHDTNLLTIWFVAQFVEMLGGKMWIEVHEKKKTTIWFSLPTKQAKPYRPAPPGMQGKTLWDV